MMTPCTACLVAPVPRWKEANPRDGAAGRPRVGLLDGDSRPPEGRDTRMMVEQLSGRGILEIRFSRLPTPVEAPF